VLPENGESRVFFFSNSRSSNIIDEIEKIHHCPWFGPTEMGPRPKLNIHLRNKKTRKLNNGQLALSFL